MYKTIEEAKQNAPALSSFGESQFIVKEGDGYNVIVRIYGQGLPVSFVGYTIHAFRSNGVGLNEWHEI